MSFNLKTNDEFKVAAVVVRRFSVVLFFSNKTTSFLSPVFACLTAWMPGYHQCQPMIDLDISFSLLSTTATTLLWPCLNRKRQQQHNVFTTLSLLSSLVSVLWPWNCCAVALSVCLSLSLCVVITDLFDCQIAQLRPADAHTFCSP